ncbi:MAG: hypothetical protein QOE36_2741 [Gaiellaceae bacterium]|jgi:hypothetical protein|nr:hypothetical protein [Gaiellaceae bacterium]
MQSEPQIAFVVENEDSPALEIRVNFGVFAGRDATSAELDDLAGELLPLVGEVAVIAEQRHEMTEDVEIAIHQVKIELGAEQLPDDPEQRAKLRERLVGTAEHWAHACMAERSAHLAEL